ncbi:MAG: lipid-binding SYLF domain-containing protein [Desulfuromonadales bacterium]|jgi:lipid-binding SYLF domain-containing protein
MKKWSLRFATLLVALAIFSPVPGQAADKLGEKVGAAVTVMQQIMSVPENAIPPELLKNAYGIAIIPGVIKAGFIVGGRYGTGVLAVREKSGNWSPPTFISLYGGSIGWQIGASSTDIILVFKTPRSVEGIMHGKYTLGADVAVAAGPVGRSAEAATDVQLKAEIYSYSRSRGIFAGISLEGAALKIDDDDNAQFYGKPGISARNILDGKVPMSPPSVAKLRKMLTQYAPSP